MFLLTFLLQTSLAPGDLKHRRWAPMAPTLIGLSGAQHEARRQPPAAVAVIRGVPDLVIMLLRCSLQYAPPQPSPVPSARRPGRLKPFASCVTGGYRALPRKPSRHTRRV